MIKIRPCDRVITAKEARAGDEDHERLMRVAYELQAFSRTLRQASSSFSSVEQSLRNAALLVKRML